MISDVTGDERVQRRGRIVIVAMIALFLLACVALGIFLWQRQQHEQQLEALSRTGLTTAGVPAWPAEIDSVEPLPDNVGLVVHYRSESGDVATGFHTLNLRAGANADLCALLARAEPDFAAPDRCVVEGDRLSAALTGPMTIANAEGQVRADTLVVLIAHPADYTAQELDAWLRSVEMETLRGLLDREG